MTASVKLTQIQDVSGDKYTLETTLSEHSTSGANWDNCFILMRVVDPAHISQDVYEHICTVGDLENYLTTRTESPPVPDAGVFYRTSTCTLSFDSLEDAVAEATLQQQRIQYLADDWDAYTNEGVWPNTVFDATISS